MTTTPLVAADTSLMVSLVVGAGSAFLIAILSRRKLRALAADRPPAPKSLQVVSLIAAIALLPAVIFARSVALVALAVVTLATVPYALHQLRKLPKRP